MELDEILGFTNDDPTAPVDEDPWAVVPTSPLSLSGASINEHRTLQQIHTSAPSSDAPHKNSSSPVSTHSECTTKTVPYDARLLPFLIPAPVTLLKSDGKSGYVNILDFWVHGVKDGTFVPMLQRRDVATSTIATKKRVTPTPTPTTTTTTTATPTQAPPTGISLSSSSWRQSYAAKRVKTTSRKTGGQHWRWCTQQSKITGVPYPKRKDVLLMYLLQCGITLQSEMVDYIKTKMPKIVDTFFTRDGTFLFDALMQYLSKAKRIKSGPTVEDKAGHQKKGYCDWFAIRKRDSSSGRHYNDFCHAVSATLSPARQRTIQHDYQRVLKRYVKQYQLPVDPNHDVFVIHWPPKTNLKRKRKRKKK